MAFAFGHHALRGTLTAALAAIVVTAMPLPSVSQSSPAPAVLRIAAGLTDPTTPLLYAQSAGLFAKAGLTVQIQRPQSGAATAAALVGGALEIGKSSLIELFNAHLRGVPFVWIAPSGIYRSDAPDGGLIVARNSPLRTGRDFNGKIVAVTALNDLNMIGTRAWVDSNGGDSSTLRFVELPPSAVPDALENGRIDAATIFTPVYEQAIGSGKARLAARVFDAIAKRYLAATWFTTAGYADAHPDVISRFVLVMREANAYCNAHPGETLPLIAAFSGIDPAAIVHMTRSTAALYLDARDVQPLIEAAVKYKILEHSFPAQELFSPLALKAPR
jgi:NitT/TauT family transport system substrate-binding protein